MTDLENKVLTDVYSEFYNGENGQCKNYTECSKRLRNKEPKHQCDRVRIGRNYGQVNVPKILFVGIEGFCDCNNESKIVDSFSTPSSTADNSHYNGLLYVAQYLLSDYGKCPKPNLHIEKNENDQYNLTDKFALTNLYRCAFTSKDNQDEKRGLTHTVGMKKHCQEILIKEIDYLQPDFLVVQTSQWPDGLFKKMKDSYGFAEPKIGFGNNNQTSVYFGSVEGKPLVLICTYHGAYGKFSSKEYLKDELNPVLDEAIKLMKNWKMKQYNNYKKC